MEDDYVGLVVITADTAANDDEELGIVANDDFEVVAVYQVSFIAGVVDVDLVTPAVTCVESLFFALTLDWLVHYRLLLLLFLTLAATVAVLSAISDDAEAAAVAAAAAATLRKARRFALAIY